MMILYGQFEGLPDCGQCVTSNELPPVKIRGIELFVITNNTNGKRDMYAGDLSPKATFEALNSEPNAVLVDVRTPCEWQYVGLPEMANLFLASWPPPPEQPDFVANIKGLGIEPDHRVYLICRSGIRSARAAAELTAAGFPVCFNVAEGFEGDRDANGHRGTIGGWKAAGLPWVQG